MNLDIYQTLTSGAFALFVGVASIRVLQELIADFYRQKAPLKSYSQRISKLTSNLAKSSAEVDVVLREMAQVVKERESAANSLQQTLDKLEEKERAAKERISVLQNVPIPVAEHLAKLMEPSERRSAKRDYLLFAAGVVVTTLIAIILERMTKQ